MAPPAETNCAASGRCGTFSQKLEDIMAKFDEYGRKHKEHMVQQMAKQGTELEKQQQRKHVEEQRQQAARPLTTPVYSFTWSCRLSSFGHLPLPWQAA
uniref:Uncharacterized protein n=1 Tax=Tetradesmus obliquus TaxID=3088 RepID=A0A383W4V3_TETOB